MNNLYNIDFKSNFTQIPNSILENPELASIDKCILFSLISKAHLEDWDFSGYRIAKTQKECNKTVFASIKRLEDLGYIKREKKGSGRTLYYLLNPNSEPSSKIVYKKNCLQEESSTISNTENNTNTENHIIKTNTKDCSDDGLPIFDLTNVDTVKLSDHPHVGGKFDKKFCLEFHHTLLIPLELYLEWINYRWAIKKPYKSLRALKSFIKKLGTLKDPEFSVNQAMDHDWINVIDDKQDYSSTQSLLSTPEGKESIESIIDTVYNLNGDTDEINACLADLTPRFKKFHDLYKVGSKGVFFDDFKYFVKAVISQEESAFKVSALCYQWTLANVMWETSCKLMNSANNNGKLNWLPTWKSFKNFIDGQCWKLESKTGENVECGSFLPLDAEYYPIKPDSMKDHIYYQHLEDHPGHITKKDIIKDGE